MYSPEFEHDNCGVGCIANINGDRTHDLIPKAMVMLNRMVHRGAVSADMKTGDGAGILLQLPYGYFEKISRQEGLNLPGEGEYGVGMLFLPNDSVKREKVSKILEDVVAREKGTVLGWREVPVKPEVAGDIARSRMPHIKQIFITFKGLSQKDLERRLYITRRSIENTVKDNGFTIEDFYICSFSCRTILYKGMFVGEQMEKFFVDLANKDFKTALAMVHQRYSTNTFPSWSLAQPFRYMLHNGEINTVQGNQNKMHAREKRLASELYGDEISKLYPIVDSDLSDSGRLDNVLELLLHSGREIEHVLMMMIPEPFGSKYHISADKRAFYEYHASMMEPWDGPAAIVFTDGKKIGATLDRNGLRPCRYVITKSGKLILSSEVGVVDLDEKDIVKKGRLAPGKMILVDTTIGRVLHNDEIKAVVSRKQPYRRWLNQNVITPKKMFIPSSFTGLDKETLELRQKAFGYTMEDRDKVILRMAADAKEPISSMGNDTNLPVLSEQIQPLFSFFKQKFAQVTNPAIDPLREELVMSLMSFIGCERNILSETPEHCRQLKVPNPIFSSFDMGRLRELNDDSLKIAEISTLYNSDGTGITLEAALNVICKKAEKEIVQNNATIIILSDKQINEKKCAIPALLVSSALHNYLVKNEIRQLCGIVVESGEPREVHHFATLIGFGVDAINPYLTFETIESLWKKGFLPENIALYDAIENYIIATGKGLKKIMSKIGISTIRSYMGAQIFECIGLSSSVTEKYFTGVPSRIGGLEIEDISRETRERHNNAYNDSSFTKTILNSGGDIHYRKDSLKHSISPEAIVSLQKAVINNDYAKYKEYSNEIEKADSTLRSLLTFKDQTPINIDEVEPASEIVKRFVVAAMSFGAMSKETHETLAIAMNRIGASSNSGEGGEDEERFKVRENGDFACSKVKQIASGRFGVNSNYLVNAEELQIKIAQGAKPGEGGQLPGHKVNDIIAKVRYSTPGVTLISPPPHHDIYSIEDLAQLIFDLQNANDKARISVKLVSEAGVGTIAAGVAKGSADMILISSHDGGTGASPLSSTKHAGIPWEMGLAETQQTLVLNGLRNKVRLQCDGKMRTGRDVMVATLLGAEEFGFGTVALLTIGCVMMRKCHLNTCPFGIATQDPELRKRFRGRPENVINFMTFVAEEIREYMALLGIRKFDDLVGRVDLLKTKDNIENWKARKVDFSLILTKPEVKDQKELRFDKYQKRDYASLLDTKLIENAKEALENKKQVSDEYAIISENRTTGTMLSAEVSRKYGTKGLKPDTIVNKFKGSAGQCFGAFLARGITFKLEGESNDYVGKGLSGGKIVIYPSKKADYKSNENSIVGNVILFGATAGEVYIDGLAGERFAVRNSGATAVVLGVGDHGCEYMTGGTVVILGATGSNFAAGMSGGIAYVLDDDQLFDTRCNLEMVDVEHIKEQEDKEKLFELIKNHSDYTSSSYSKNIVDNWDAYLPRFVKVMPLEYRRVLELRKKEQENK